MLVALPLAPAFSAFPRLWPECGFQQVGDGGCAALERIQKFAHSGGACGAGLGAAEDDPIATAGDPEQALPDDHGMGAFNDDLTPRDSALVDGLLAYQPTLCRGYGSADVGVVIFFAWRCVDEHGDGPGSVMVPRRPSVSAVRGSLRCLPLVCGKSDGR